MDRYGTAARDRGVDIISYDSRVFHKCDIKGMHIVDDGSPVSPHAKQIAVSFHRFDAVSRICRSIEPDTIS